MTFTLKIIFVGLFSLAPISDEEALLLAVRAPHHMPRIEQLKGKCTGDCFVVSRQEADDVKDSTDQLRWWPDDIEIRVGLDERVSLLLAPAIPAPTYPSNEAESKSLSWIPSVARMVPGPSPLRPSCRERAETCNISFRVRIDGGELQTCHLAHVPKDCPNGRKLMMFQVGSRIQAIGDAISLIVEIADSKVSLVGRDYSGNQVQSAILSPVDGDVTLIVSNEPPIAVPSPCTLPSQIGHFPHFYQLLHPVTGLLGRFSNNIPVRVEQFETGYPGTCEEVLGDYYDDKYPSAAGVVVYPHSPTECAESTIP